jgi:hypothetical protein
MKCRTFSRRWPAARAMTLVEVVAGLALLGSVLVGILLARGACLRQTARSNRRLEAVAAADALLTAWHQDPALLKPEGGGPLAGDGQLAWRTAIVPSAEARSLGARIVRLEVFDQRVVASPWPVLASVEFLIEPENSAPSAPPTTVPLGTGASQQAKHRGMSRTHAPGIHTP